MKKWEEEYAKRIAARIAGFGSYPYYNMDVLGEITALRLYHDLIYDYEVARIFTQDPETVKHITEVLPILSIYLFFDALHGV